MRTVSSTHLKSLSEVTAQDSRESPFAEISPAHKDFDHSVFSENNSFHCKSRTLDTVSDGKHRRNQDKKTSSKNDFAFLSLLPRVLGNPQYSAGTILVLICALAVVITLLTIQSINIASASLSSESLHTEASPFPGKQDKKSTGNKEHTGQSSDKKTKNDGQQETQASNSSQNLNSGSTGIYSSSPQELSSSRNEVSDQAPSVSQQQASPGVGININSASLEELQEIPGVGPTLARRIIDYRIVNGRFTSIEDLLSVSGIGVKKFEKMKNHVRI
ncbi:helix-hairpin-helix domain-containing protein [Alloscardovia theropitheci]|uniref:Helix-hairpin-helix domain-containing protein n=1 Tax=Alloscardovia theropitheci TaxID=2496842 RepID=A0A4R0QN01_9BIFI|nr:helix-hairpin-helix domain-containing protein [Alloscardovia theropitheci]TCD53552.1 helix-hairpin-helix domain-containing protein [Alloscardovia theropitheci]